MECNIKVGIVRFIKKLFETYFGGRMPFFHIQTTSGTAWCADVCFYYDLGQNRPFNKKAHSPLGEAFGEGPKPHVEQKVEECPD